MKQNYFILTTFCLTFCFLTACALPGAVPTPANTPIVLQPTIEQTATLVVVRQETSSVGSTESITRAAEVATVPVVERAQQLQEEPAPALVDQPVTAIVVGVNAVFDPFESIDESGALIGFDIDLMNALAQATGIEVSFQDMDFNALILAVVNGEIDAAISAITLTDERQALVAFTQPYFTSDQSPVSFFGGGQGLAVRTETTMIHSAADLTGDVKVGVKSGTTGDFFVVENTSDQIVRFDEIPTALMALANGEIDAVVTDIAVIAEFVSDHQDLGVQLMGKPLTIESYAIAVNQERIDLLQIFDAGLTKIRENGTYDQVFEKWFQLP